MNNKEIIPCNKIGNNKNSVLIFVGRTTNNCFR